MHFVNQQKHLISAFLTLDFCLLHLFFPKFPHAFSASQSWRWSQLLNTLCWIPYGASVSDLYDWWQHSPSLLFSHISIQLRCLCAKRCGSWRDWFRQSRVPTCNHMAGSLPSAASASRPLFWRALEFKQSSFSIMLRISTWASAAI